MKWPTNIAFGNIGDITAAFLWQARFIHTFLQTHQDVFGPSYKVCHGTRRLAQGTCCRHPDSTHFNKICNFYLQMTTELCFLIFEFINNRWKPLRERQCVCCTTWGESLKALELEIWTVTHRNIQLPVEMNNAYYFEINILLETEKSDLKNIFTNLYKSFFFVCPRAWTASPTLSLGSRFSISGYYPCRSSSAHLCCFMMQSCSLNQLGLKVKWFEVFFLC